MSEQMVAAVTTGLLLPPLTSNPPNTFLTSTSLPRIKTFRPFHPRLRTTTTTITAATSSYTKPIRFRPLDRHVTKANRLRFVRKLTTLLLSKPRHFLPLKVLSRCRHYLHPTRPLLRMVLRYPALFLLFHTPPSSISSSPLLCVGLTPAAVAMATEESQLKSRVSEALAVKLQKLLMMTSHKRLPLKKIVHLAPDLGLPVDFRSRLCRRFPEKFRVAESEFGWVLELVEWDENVAVPVKSRETEVEDERKLIIDRPLKFKHLKLRKGLNLKRRHRDYLLRFQELPEVSPYSSYTKALEAGLAERRACAVVREILAMTVERRTLVDHLTHFRKEMGLPNKLRGLMVRHPEMFYISLKGMRDSVFLVDGYDDKGQLVKKDELLATKERLMELVSESKRMRRARRKDTSYGDGDGDGDDETEEDDDCGLIDDGGDEEDALEDLFETSIGNDWEEFIGIDAESLDIEQGGDEGVEAVDFWRMKDGSSGDNEEKSRVW